MPKINKEKSDEFIKAYEEYADAIFRHFYFRAGGSKELAKDLLQDVFIKTWSFIAKGGKVKNFRPFLYKTANNLLIDYYRKKKRIPVSLDNLKEKGIEPRLSIKEEKYSSFDAEKIREVVNTLKPIIYRDIVIMHYIDELSITETAKLLNISENAVYVRVHRAIKKLTKILKKYERDF